MRDISTKLKNRIIKNVTTVATCILLKLKSDTQLGFTDHVEDLIIDDLIYHANSGFSSSSIESHASFVVDNLEIYGFLDAKFITTEDILSGVYDYAYVMVFAVDYTAPEIGKIILKTGYLGEITLLNNQFTAEIRGISEALGNNIGKLYSPTCRAEFCGLECKVNRSEHLEHGVVSEVVNKTYIKSKNLNANNHLYAFGSIKFSTGKNKDLSRSLKECRNESIVLMLAFPYQIQKGDEFVIYPGCDKNFETCCNHYNNAINFHGEPHLPGMDEMYKTAGTFR